MEYRRLGKSGLRLSALSFGSWVTFKNQLDQKNVERLMAIAYERGVNFFDNAEVYADGESEVLMGQALSKLNWTRDSYCVSSKVFWGGEKPTQMGLSRKHIVDACNSALKRLQVDYLDLYFCHRPDIHTPVEETARAMSDLVRQGKILYWGTSEWNAQQITEAYGVAARENLVPPSMEQPEYNLLHRERVEKEYAPLYKNFGLGTTIWSPLASGVLTGKYSQGIPADSRFNVPGFEWLGKRYSTEEGKQKIATVSKLEPMAKHLGISLAQLSLAWCLKNPNVSTVILGATKESQLTENLSAMDALAKIDASTMKQIDEVVGNAPASEKDWTE